MPMIDGKEYRMCELAKMSGINESTIRSRLKNNPNITLSQATTKPASYGWGTIRKRNGEKVPASDVAEEIGIGYKRLMRWKRCRPKATYEDAVKWFAENKEKNEDKMWRMVEEQDPVWLGSFSKGTESEVDHYSRLCQLCGIDDGYAEEMKRRYPDA